MNIDINFAKVKSVKLDVPNHLTAEYVVKVWDGRAWLELCRHNDIQPVLDAVKTIVERVK